MMTSPIDRYIQALGAQLDMTKADCTTTLEEVRAHLEEKATGLRATGLPQLQAEQGAVGAFGDSHFVAQRISAAHPTHWSKRRWLSGIGLGMVLTWVIWTLGTFPVLANDVYTHALTYPQDSRPTTSSIVIQSTPLTAGGWYAFNLAGWLWLAPLLIAFLTLPFLWGRRTRTWWAPGLAYGLGAWFSAPWFVMIFFVPTLDFTFRDEGVLLLLAVPLAVAASGLGHLARSSRQQRAPQLVTS